MLTSHPDDDFFVAFLPILVIGPGINLGSSWDLRKMGYGFPNRLKKGILLDIY